MTALLLPWGCGGRATESSSAPEEDASVNGGAGHTTDECLGGGAPDGGCEGEAGDHPLEDYAPLRVPCGRNVHVNRADGGAVTICSRIR